jgi:FkbM family methyltransferase
VGFIEIDRRAPVVHKLAYRMTVERVRGSLKMWQIVERLRPLPMNATMSLRGQQLPIDLMDRTTSVNIYRGFYERAELALLQRLVHPGDACVDVGANAGLYTLALRVLSGTAGSVVAFEPNPVMASKVRELVASTVGSPVTVIEAALGNEDGTATLHLFDGDSGLATLRGWDIDGTGAVDVAMRRLEDVQEVEALGEISLLKIDVESWEPQVLAGGWRLFDEGRVRAALVELATDASASAMAELLARLSGYQPLLILFERRALRWQPRLRPLTLTELASGKHPWSNMLLLRDDAATDVGDLISAS